MLDDGMENSGQVSHGDSPMGGGRAKVLLSEIVLDNTPKRKKNKKARDRKSPEVKMEVKSEGEDTFQECAGEDSSSVELKKKKKKKKGHVVVTKNENSDSDFLLGAVRTSEEVKQNQSTSSYVFCAPKSDTLQTKKKKKKNVNVNEDDAPESVDSGCVVDSSVESLETDWDQVKSALKVEHQFMSRLLAWVPRPTEINPDDVLAPTVTSDKKRKAVHFKEDEEDDGKKWKKKKKAGEMAKEAKFKKELREGHELVENYEELRNRWIEKLESLRVNRKKAPKSAAEKREEQKLKMKLKKLEGRRKQKLKKVQKKEVAQAEGNKEGNVAKPKKPIYTNDGQLVFSKFDFSTSSKEKEGKKKQDLNKLLSQALKEKEKVKQLVEEGKIGKANELKEKKAWKGALMRAQGEKVKDDPELLKKSLKKKEGKKKQSQKKWEQRLASEEKKKTELSQKKQSNVKARKSEKLKNKMKKMKKKGHIVPGF